MKEEKPDQNAVAELTREGLYKENKWLWEENKKLKDDLLHYIRREEDYREENKKLKSDLSECECSMHFENDEVGYRKRECKKLKEKVETLELWLDNKEKLNEKYRKEIDKYKKQYEHSMGFSDFGGYDE